MTRKITFTIWSHIRSGKIHKKYKVDYFTFKNAPRSLRKKWVTAINQVVKSGQFVGGPHLSAFEKVLRNYLYVWDHK